MKLKSAFIYGIVFSASAWANFSGHVFATDGTLNPPPVQQNQFNDPNAVYLSGGPQNTNSNGLPVGTYYFQLTDSSGKTLLSEDDLSCRQVVVTLVGGVGVISGMAPLPMNCTPGAHAPGFTDVNGGVTLQLQPFAQTPGNGGVYKLWLTPVDQWVTCPTTAGDVAGDTMDSSCKGGFGFLDGSSKTDNFKVCTGVACATTQHLISGIKYFDVNVANTTDKMLPLAGISEPNDIGLSAWTVNIYAGTDTSQAPIDAEVTDADGAWSYFVNDNTQVTACEVLQTGWSQSGPRSSYSSVYTNAPVSYNPPGTVATNGAGVKCWQITVGTADVTGVDFGNYIQVTGTKYYSLNGADGGSTVPNWPITVTCDATATANLYCLNGGLNTDANGNYLFIPTGPVASYTVCEGGEPNWVQTYPTVPLAVNGANATACTMTSAGWAGVLGTATGSGLDFGNYATVSGTKYYSGTSTGLQGWTITLNPGGATAVTGANGKYTITVPSFPFSNGSVCETLQAGWTESSPSPSSNGGCYSYGLTAIAPTVTPVASSLDFYNEILLSGLKFYDLNLDQIQDNGEPGIGSFKIALYSCLGTGCTPGVTPAYAYTAVDGTFTWAAPGPITNYKVCEVLPATGNWTEITMPSCYLGTVGAANQTALNFGNVCEGTVNPYTQGFWQNKNGTAMLTSALNYPGWAQSMNSFNNNTDAGWSGYLSFVPTTTTKYGMKWFLAIAGSSNASKDDTEISSGLFTTTSGTNAANMLSSQLATMELNTLITNGVGGNPAPNVNNTAFMKVGTAATLTANGCNPASLPSLNAAGYATILDVETYGNTLLLFSANTTASGPARSCQVLIQTALNSANNNQALSIIQPTSCKVPTY